jgi:N-acetylmuramoyl-L-alanine amidase
VIFRIGKDHWLEGVQRVPLPPRGAMRVRRYVVEHFTGGADGDGDTDGDHVKDAYSAVDAMRDRGVSAHIVVDRDGTVIQCVAFDQKAWHAGASRWRDPGTGKIYSSAAKQGGNDCAIGIEIANAGSDLGALTWARKQKGFQSFRGRHRNGGPVMEWECFPAPQMEAVTAVTLALVKRYNLDDVTGHDCIASWRKDDPGPAFPMRELREACGFKGLPEVFRA